jgi:hypothetical protein
VFSAVRNWGGNLATAYAAQGALALLLAASLAWLWHSDPAFELKAGARAAGSLPATPYVLDYDLVVLAVAIALLARHGLRCGFRDFEISLLAAAWLVPLLSRSPAPPAYRLAWSCCSRCVDSPCGARRSIMELQVRRNG